MSRILMVNRFYHPDLGPTARLLGDLAEHLAERGTEVTVIAGRMRYDRPQVRLAAAEIRRRVRIRRIPTTRFGRRRLAGRAGDYATFCPSAFHASAFRTPPADRSHDHDPGTIPQAGRVFRRGSPFPENPGGQLWRAGTTG